MGIWSSLGDFLTFLLDLFTSGKDISKPIPESIRPAYSDFMQRQGLFESLPFKQCLIRNEEMNNSLMVEDCHPISIREITKNSMRLSWVPDIPALFAPANHLQKWALMVVDQPNEPISQGIENFDYHKIVLIEGGNQQQRTLFFTAQPHLLADIDTWKNAQVILFNPFLSVEYKQKPLISLPPHAERPDWCRAYISPAAMFQRRDGKYILLVNGERRKKGELPQQKVGAFISSHPWNDDFKPLNSTDISQMTPIFEGSAAHHSGDSFQITSLMKSKDPGYWIGYGNGRNGSRWNVVAVKFDENFNHIEYFNEIIIPAEPNCESGEYFPTVIQYHNHYRMMWVNRLKESYTTWFLTEGISDNELGPFDPQLLTSNPVLLSTTWHNGSFRSNHTHIPAYFLWNNELYCIIDGTSRWSTSGNRANRLFGVMKYDAVKQIWLEDLRNPLFLNPMYGDQAWGDTWKWCNDHLGGRQFFWKMNTGELLFFFSANHGFDNYEVALAKMKQTLA